MKRNLSTLLAICTLTLAACASKPSVAPGHKLVLETIRRPNRPPVYLYREVPDPDAH